VDSGVGGEERRGGGNMTCKEGLGDGEETRMIIEIRRNE
jgi:hypothetical protein